jgi:DNA-3-methyladenine glycosylase
MPSSASNPVRRAPPLAAPASARLVLGDYATDSSALARALLGRRLVRVLDDRGGSTRISGIIVETEAYLGEPDRASHAFGLRRTPRNEAMYARPSTSYVYFTYGMHFCMNVVCGEVNQPLAVLIRALEPVEGLEHMRRHRARRKGKPDPRRGPIDPALFDTTDLCSGPGKLCHALEIDRTLNHIDLVTVPRLFIEHASPPIPPSRIARSARIGVASVGGPWATAPLRFYIKDNPHVSR